jgi:hypothetical protein
MSGYSGGTTKTDIARLRRMVDEGSAATYTDAALVAIITAYPVPDALGEDPVTRWGVANAEWVATYDLAAAAADIWAEKASALATGAFDFTADGATYNRSQVGAGAKSMVAYWSSRRMALPRTLKAEIGRGDDVIPWIGNLPEPTEYNT